MITQRSFCRNLRWSLPGLAIWIATVLLGHAAGLFPTDAALVVWPMILLGAGSGCLFIFGVFLPLGATHLRETTPPDAMAQPRYAGAHFLVRVFAIRAEDER